MYPTYQSDEIDLIKSNPSTWFDFYGLGWSFILNIWQVELSFGLIVFLEHSHQLSHKKCHFDTSKTYFIILAHHFTISHLSDCFIL